MTETFPALLVQVAQAHPALGVPLLVDALCTGRLRRNESPQENVALTVTEVLTKTALLQSRGGKASELFVQLFLKVSPTKWREALGDQGVEGLTAAFEGRSPTRCLLAFWAQRTSETRKNDGVTAELLDAWFSDLSQHPQQLKHEAPGQLLHDCLALGLRNYAQRVWSVWCVSGPLDLNRQGLPAVLAIRHQELWDRFIAQGGDMWQLVAARDKPLIVAMIESQPQGSFRKSLQKQAWEDIASKKEPTPEMRIWAVSEIKRVLRHKVSLDASRALVMLRTAGPDPAVCLPFLKPLGLHVGCFAWFDALLSDATLAPALGTAKILEARYELAFTLLQASSTDRSNDLNAQDAASTLARLPGFLSASPPPKGEGWIRAVSLSNLGPIKAKQLARLMAPYQEEWWGCDRPATERWMFEALAECVSSSRRDVWQGQVQTFLAMAGDANEMGPWLRVSHCLAQSLTAARGQDQLDTATLAGLGAVFFDDPAAEGALSRLSVALSPAMRKSLGAVRQGWRLDKILRRPEVKGIRPRM